MRKEKTHSPGSVVPYRYSIQSCDKKYNSAE
jgi:hypothetical protein